MKLASTWQVGRIAGIVVILIFGVSVFTSWAFYPKPYSPFTNWLSDLGNSNYNPKGAIFFNVGLILTGIAFFPFCLGLYKWYTNEKKRKINFILVQVSGFLLAFSIVMVGVFSEDYMTRHSLWSSILFISLGFFLFLLTGFLFTHPSNIKLIAYYGFAVGAIDIVFGLVYNTYLLEWVTVFSSIGYIALIVYNMFKK